jgi:hypothetical protein
VPGYVGIPFLFALDGELGLEDGQKWSPEEIDSLRAAGPDGAADAFDGGFDGNGGAGADGGGWFGDGGGFGGDGGGGGCGGGV